MPTAFGNNKANYMTKTSVLATLTSAPISLNMTDIPFTFRPLQNDPTKLEYLEIGLVGLTNAKKLQIQSAFQGLSEVTPEDEL